MSDKLDFIALGGHGSGLNAFDAFIPQLEDVVFLYRDLTEEKISAFLGTNTSKKHGVLIDRISDAYNALLPFIIRNLSPDFSLIVLTRDPLARIKSVCNTHIQWWAESVAGTYEMPLQSTKLYNSGDSQSLLAMMLADNAMNTVTKRFQLFAQKCRNLLFLDISDLYASNIHKTFDTIAQTLRIGKPHELSVPDALPFSRENLFVRHVRKLRLNYSSGKGVSTISIKPCPAVFCDIYGFSEENTILSVNPEEIGFTLGKFPGKVSFVICNDNGLTQEAISKIRKSIENDSAKINEILLNYTADLSRRHHFSHKLYAAAELTDERIMKFSTQTPAIAKLLYEFMASQLSVVGNAAPSIVKGWRDSIMFMNKLRKLLH